MFVSCVLYSTDRRQNPGQARQETITHKVQKENIKQFLWVHRFFAPVQTSNGTHPISCTMGTVSYPGVKRPGRGVNHPLASGAEVK
jgi:hypothetical protein